MKINSNIRLRYQYDISKYVRDQLRPNLNVTYLRNRESLVLLLCQQGLILNYRVIISRDTNSQRLTREFLFRTHPLVCKRQTRSGTKTLLIRDEFGKVLWCKTSLIILSRGYPTIAILTLENLLFSKIWRNRMVVIFVSECEQNSSDVLLLCLTE